MPLEGQTIETQSGTVTTFQSQPSLWQGYEITTLTIVIFFIAACLTVKYFNS